jgi:hypothetical protein
MSRGRRGPYVTWTKDKLAAVQPHLYLLEEGPRLAAAKQALVDAGFPQEAAILTLHKLKTAQSKLKNPQREAIAISHKQAAKKKTREKQRQAEGDLNLRAQGERLSVKCHTWVFFLTVLSDVANVARIQQRVYPGVPMNGVLPGMGPFGAPEAAGAGQAEEAGEITFTFEDGEGSLEDSTPLCLPPVIVQAAKNVPGARSVVRIAASQSLATNKLTLSIDREDSHKLVLTYEYNVEAVDVQFADTERFQDTMTKYHLTPEALTGPHDELTYAPLTYTTTIRFSEKLGKQFEVEKFEMAAWTLWIIPFEHVEGRAAPSAAKKRRFTLEL